MPPRKRQSNGDTRTPVEDRPQVSWRMDPEDHAVLAAEAFLRKCSYTELARGAVDALIEELKQKPDVKDLLDRQARRQTQED